MSATTLAFLCGAVVGGSGGIFVVALCMAAGRSDDASRDLAAVRRWERINPPEDVDDASWMYSERGRSSGDEHGRGAW